MSFDQMRAVVRYGTVFLDVAFPLHVLAEVRAVETHKCSYSTYSMRME